MTKSKKQAIMKWTMFVSFIVLIVGGLNYLIMGMLEFDLFGEIFGYDTIAGRVLYTIFGVAAVILASMVICKVYGKQEKESKSTTTRKSTTDKPATAS